jgi:16S rRNA A1518/A1519 N6-dimethyltransferase RsmA/KsgA/DIM1 with predicted DNA glycosylase/AP lyase activity
MGVEPARFLPFVRASFAQKRKTWANNLRAAGYKAEAVGAALANNRVSPAVRAEAVGLTDMAAVFSALHA